MESTIKWINDLLSCVGLEELKKLIGRSIIWTDEDDLLAMSDREKTLCSEITGISARRSKSVGNGNTGLVIMTMLTNFIIVQPNPRITICKATGKSYRDSHKGTEEITRIYRMTNDGNVRGSFQLL